jgi:hypothetical protein
MAVHCLQNSIWCKNNIVNQDLGGGNVAKPHGRGSCANHNCKVILKQKQPVRDKVVVFHDTEATTIRRIILTKLILIVTLHSLVFTVRSMFPGATLRK